MRQHQPAKTGSVAAILAFLAGLILIGAALVMVWQRQAIVDAIIGWQYEPSPEIRQIKDDTTMSAQAERLFYASRPELQAAAEFNQSCQDVEKSAAVLGCYVSRQIFIFDVASQELAGIKEVTAAHEMLHAAYDRLPAAELDQVNDLIEKEWRRLRENREFSDRMSAYDLRNDQERLNELHSIIGTEVSDIGSELEEYYARYFDDRSQVVQLRSQYWGVLRQYQSRAESLSTRLNSLSENITLSQATYERSLASINSRTEQFNQRAASGDFTSRSQFEAERAALVRDQASVQAQYRQLMSSIQLYNQLVDEHNNISRHLADLAESMDSRTVAPPGGE